MKALLREITFDEVTGREVDDRQVKTKEKRNMNACDCEADGGLGARCIDPAHDRYVPRD